MLRSQLGQLNVTNRRDNAFAQVFVQLDCTMLCAGMLLEVDNILCILGKRLVIVRLKPQLDAVLKLVGNFLCLPLGTLLRPVFRRFPSLLVTALAVAFIIAARNRDFEAQAGFCVDYLYAWHVFLSFRVE